MLMARVVIAAAKRVHAEHGVEEGAALRLGELPMDEHPADRAMHPYLAELVHAVQEEVGLRVPEQRLPGHLNELGALLEPLTFDLHYARKPFRVAVRVADQAPYRRDGRIDQRLGVDLGHRCPQYSGLVSPRVSVLPDSSGFDEP